MTRSYTKRQKPQEHEILLIDEDEELKRELKDKPDTFERLIEARLTVIYSDLKHMSNYPFSNKAQCHVVEDLWLRIQKYKRLI